MLFDLPSDDVLYDALIARNPAYEGQAFVAVRTTGIFCRLTCPARKPNRENCTFFGSTAECLEAGFRPCRRCHPLGPAAEADPGITKLLAALEAAPTRRWQERDIAAMGLDPSTVRRSFKRHFGVTFLDMARQRRLAHGFTALGNSKVIDAQLEAGFDSPSGFRAAFAKLLGQAPAEFQRDALLQAAHIATPLGAMIAVCDHNALHLLEFADRKALPAELRRLRKMAKGQIGIGETAITTQVRAELDAYFTGTSGIFKTALALHGTPFTKNVWRALQTIKPGETRGYAALAKAIGSPQAVRAVARANGANQIAIMIPCHRVIGSNGALTGYGGGLWRKQKLLEIEHLHARKAQR
ncbi:trifunctional transcriptional activator/DNA repair protein Ada/methylated-DNA--[protein]-cysteine S-methyltransferase [Cognatiyoonia sp. IB215182]|uniref:bifunctional transcriptional activator/DNA repair enzyme AdaA n=1 Tax=Cognatiyoonia sp. IB215182 TaxID=3097353 RepID=UPI002A0D3DBB|nr:trifunctional transcriptional activator/DNA repair protein Ada/methylated-DNA--[protein]-cysteine S-methyltransferase [Cognatiyoonia sp. IB215182]MDX8353432.1 trifunctional transcriptional activator/DNA repair protein Ada/methylated-DNA--[protein]-cysteine S-methyltransferase [Cognatiyoonia sp. IB215182]